MNQNELEQSPNYRKGVALVGEMLGPQFLAGMQAAAGSGSFAADCAAIALESAFGAVWSRPGLDRKQRSLVTMGILIGTGKPSELKNHVRAGLNNGLTVLEIQEVLIQSIPYAGFPCVAEAIEATVAVLRERGLVDDNTKTAKDRGML
ncbi:MAG TPA: carboxymuconolactone decarboxylase family protein [Steroidobacteraceae bacterium]|nr:carboxymuconolactone decarboxylase family protein [Steroidobacteraceae bacterium]